MTSRAKWIVGGVFWILFLLSLALYQRNRWVDRVWSTAVWVFLSATFIYFIARSIRNRAIKGTGGYQQWFIRFAYDDEKGKKCGNSVCSCLARPRSRFCCEHCKRVSLLGESLCGCGHLPCTAASAP